MRKNFLILLLCIFLTTHSVSALPFMDAPLKADDTIAFALNKYHEEEKRFAQKIAELKKQKFDFDKALKSVRLENPRYEKSPMALKYLLPGEFSKKYKIDLPEHLVNHSGYEWIIWSLQNLQRDSPKDFDLYKKYLPLLSQLLKKHIQYRGPFKGTQKEIGFTLTADINEKRLKEIDLFVEGKHTQQINKYLKINRPIKDFKGTRLCLGCSHAGVENCERHINKKRFEKDYTINLPGLQNNADQFTDLVGDFFNPELWKELPSNRFESVIFENVKGMGNPKLLKEIFRVLKPGGYVANFGYNENADINKAVDDFNIWHHFFGRALRTDTYIQYFNSLGFERVGNGLDDETGKLGIHAYKPRHKS